MSEEIQGGLNFILLKGAIERLEAGVAHVVVSSEGKIETWQSCLAELFGYSSEEAIGNTLESLIIPPSLREGHVRGIKTWAEKEESAGLIICRRFLTQGIHKNGGLVAIFFDVQIVRYKAGVRFLGWITRAESEAIANGTSG